MVPESSAAYPSMGLAVTPPPTGEAVQNDPLLNGQAHLSLLGMAKQGPMPWEGGYQMSPASSGMAGLSARQAQDKEMFSAVKKQMEALEDKLQHQIKGVQQQNDRSRDVAVERVNSKMSAVELNLPKTERRLAELGGNLRGLSDEMTSQIKRIDQMDSRLWEWRHKLDEEMRTKFSDMENANKQLASSVRVTAATNDDVLKRFNQRLLRIEALLDERHAHTDDLNQSIMNMHHRLLDVEHKPVGAASLSSEAAGQLGSDCSVAHLTEFTADLSQKIQDLQGELRDLNGKLEEQSEHYKVLMRSCEDKDEKHRALTDKVERENWHGHLKDLRSKLDEVSQGHDTHAEKVQIMQRKLDNHEEIHTELGNRMRGYTARKIGMGAPDESVAVEASDSSRRFAEIESQVNSFENKIEAIRSDLELAPRVAALVDTLKDVSPKIIEQEEITKNLQQQVSEIQQMGNAHSGIQSRICKLEDDVQRVAAEVEASRESNAEQNSGLGRSSIVQCGQSPRIDSTRSILGNEKEQRLSTVSGQGGRRESATSIMQDGAETGPHAISGQAAPRRVSIMECEDSQSPTAGQASRLSQQTYSRVETGKSFVVYDNCDYCTWNKRETHFPPAQDQGQNLHKLGGRFNTAPAGLSYGQETDDDNKDER